MKPLRFLASVVCISLGLAACAPPPASPALTSTPLPSATPTPSPSPLPTLGVDPSLLAGLQVPFWHAFAGSAARTFDSQVALFNSVNEWGIQVLPRGFTDYPSLAEAVTAAAASGELPLGIAALPEQVLSWHASALLLGLSPYLEDPDFGLDSSSVSDIPDVFWTRDLQQQLLGAPAQRTARYLFYNLSWARQLGFTSPPVTPQDFRLQACAANAAFKADSDLQNDGYGGWVVDTDWQTIHAWFLAFDGQVQQSGSYTLQSEPNQAALEFLKGLYDSNCAWLSTEDTPFTAFAERRALFITADLSQVPAVARTLAALSSPGANPDASPDEWTLIPFPGLQAPVVLPYGPSYAVFHSTPAAQLATWLFIRWMLSPENQAVWVESTDLLPLRLSVMDLVQPYRLASPQWQAAVSSLEYARSQPPLASWGRVRYLLADAASFIFQVNLPLDQLPSILQEMQSMAGEVSSLP